MRRTLRDKRILITGPSGGIGRAIALALAAEGASLILASRDEAKLQDLVAEAQAMGSEAIAVRADITNADDRAAMFDVAVAHFGGLDMLINNAGVGAHGHFVDLNSEILRKVMEVNFFAMAENCRLAIPLLAKGNQPLIVNVSSMAGRRGVPAWTEYSASKFAICGFSEALRAELARFDIDLTLVIPGLTKSNLASNLLAKVGRLPIDHMKGIPATVVADAVVRGIKKNKHEIRVERDARLLLFVNWLAPRYVDWRMSRVVRGLYQREIEQLRSERAAEAKAVATSGS